MLAGMQLGSARPAVAGGALSQAQPGSAAAGMPLAGAAPGLPPAALMVRPLSLPDAVMAQPSAVVYGLQDVVLVRDTPLSIYHIEKRGVWYSDCVWRAPKCDRILMQGN